jgi:uncharacterized ferredoxin-like protein
MKTAPELEQQAAAHVAALMAAAARTSPKTRGVDNIHVLVIDDEPTKQKLISKMKEIARTENRPGSERDANSIAASPALLVIGVESNTAGLNCGFCGHETCKSLEAAKGVCTFNSVDLGIATCSAAAVAGQHHVDNRVMYSIGRACLHLQFFGDKVQQALGIPLSVTGKNPYFDRKG